MRWTINQSINVNLLVQIQQIVSKAEDASSPNEALIEETEKAFDELDKSVYPSWVVSLFVLPIFVFRKIKLPPNDPKRVAVRSRMIAHVLDE